MSEKHELERQLSEMLTEGEMEDQGHRKEQERELISPRYEIRIQTKMDPIVEETLKYRSIARELDDRHDDGTWNGRRNGNTRPIMRRIRNKRQSGRSGYVTSSAFFASSRT